MPKAIVTGSGGLIGSEAVTYFAESGWEVLGIENDLRATFFGESASTRPRSAELVAAYPHNFTWVEADIRDSAAISRLFSQHSADLELVVHTAAQPSHDWAASDPTTDFGVNATGTLNLLEAVRSHKPDATFVFCSTNKVYGDRPNSLPLIELETRLELPCEHEYYLGIPTEMSIDRCLHSLFGVSKAAADLLVQEYGRYFSIPTVCFRGGCLTGPNHAGAQLHGFLAYLMKCAATKQPYTVFGYEGKQVRDNIHSADFVRAIAEFQKKPTAGAVFNLGGGRDSNCSMLEAIALCDEISGNELAVKFDTRARIGDHRWWISDTRPFAQAYPAWSIRYGVREILQAIHDKNVERWLSVTEQEEARA
jgi:CDP-paratose 2-epimerase